MHPAAAAQTLSAAPIAENMTERVRELMVDWPTTLTDERADEVQGALQDVAFAYDDDSGEDVRSLARLSWELTRATQRQAFEDDPEPAYTQPYRRLAATLDDALRHIRDVALHALNMVAYNGDEQVRTTRSKIVLLNLQIVDEMLQLAVAQARVADAARRGADAAEQPVSFDDVDKRVRRRLSGLTDDHAAGTAWEIIKTLREGSNAEQIARWFGDRHWEPWIGRPATKDGLYDTYVRFVEEDGQFRYAHVSDDDFDADLGRDTAYSRFAVIEGQPGPDTILVKLDRPKRRVAARDLQPGDTAFLHGSGVRGGRPVTDVTIAGDRVTVTRDSDLLGAGGQPIVTELAADDTAVIIPKDTYQHVPMAALERGRARYGLLQDGRAVELAEVAAAHAAAGAAGHAVGIAGTLSRPRADIVRMVQHRGMTVSAKWGTLDLLIAGTNADGVLQIAGERGITVLSEGEAMRAMS